MDDHHNQLTFWLYPSPEEFWKTDMYQLELEQFERNVANEHLTITPAHKRLKTIDEIIDYELRCEEILTGKGPQSFGYLSQTPLSGEFVVELMKALGSLGLGGIIGAWIQARHGRKVRVRVGDIEAEANTAEEVEKLLAKAMQIQVQKEPKRIQSSN